MLNTYFNHTQYNGALNQNIRVLLIRQEWVPIKYVNIPNCTQCVCLNLEYEQSTNNERKKFENYVKKILDDDMFEHDILL